ncbi:MAG TPA: D-aminoacyl-tRNA deacylase [Acidimicrobiales bacterium]|nr:D-aminoacyl-tRNA deacylase [Acidimicrobiales bacterium]
MRAVVQRVARAEVRVDGDVVGAIGPGLCLLVGATHTDTVAIADRLADKVWNLRILDDEAGVMNRSLAQASGPQALVVSQFTLYGDTRRGRRPSWVNAAPGSIAEPLIDTLARRLAARGAHVATGRFGADMQVELVNDGPVTVLLEVPPAL